MKTLEPIEVDAVMVRGSKQINLRVRITPTKNKFFLGNCVIEGIVLPGTSFEVHRSLYNKIVKGELKTLEL